MGRPLIIISREIGGEALETLVANKKDGGIDVCAIKGPGQGTWKTQNLEDIALSVGLFF